MTIQNTLLLAFFSLFVSVISFAQEKTAASLYNEGLTQLKAKDYEAGMVLMEEALVKAEADENEKVIKLAKKNGAVAAYNVGGIKRKAGALDEAMKLYARGIELNAAYASNYRGQGMVLEAQGKTNDALKAYLQAGDVYTKGEKADKAADVFKKCQNMVGKTFIAKKYDEAIMLANEYLAVKANPEVSYYLAKSQIEKGLHAEALVNATKAVDTATAPEDKYFVAQATAYENLGNNADAVASYKKVTGEKYKKIADHKISTLK